ncbi:MAG TPA: amylo-alpha-1,6-glucosidase [Gemmatimonadaceae bacterium]|nr:amylo-alpha-1,6-glucosidase [Gemmatimonadaceae bacterium]
MKPLIGLDTEWLVADGRGGFASGTAAGVRTRRYHALLLAALPTDERRFVLVNGIEAWLETAEGRVPLSSQQYAPDVTSPDGAWRIGRFAAEPWPAWTFYVGRGVQLSQEVFVPRLSGRAATLLRWRLLGDAPEGATARLYVRLLMSGRDFHALHHENPDFRFEPEREGTEGWRWQPYHGVPAVVAYANAQYRHEPTWYRQFLYIEERSRGLDCIEDLASPGVFSWELGGGAPDALLMLTVPEPSGGYVLSGDLVTTARAVHEAERARIAAFPTRLHHSADEYLVRRGERHSIIAGYPWFTDWGRDTMIALRGLCLATGRLLEAERILLAWGDTISEGMLPNVFPSAALLPAYNSVDAALWYVLAARELLDAATRRGHWLEASVRQRLTDASQEILERYERGTRYGIHMDDDGLLASGEPGEGVALTWMDAIVDGAPVTPRVGKPVEIQALWVNALTAGARWNERWGDLADRALTSAAARFWNAERPGLYDVVDVDHQRGALDARLRPNQLFALGALPVMLVDSDRARAAVDLVEQQLWTPMGLRTLAPGEPGYLARCAGDAASRDRAYHNGTAWPWLMGAFVDAWVRTRGPDNASAAAALRAGARRKYLHGLARQLDHAGVGHVSEMADGEPPHTPRGCPFQAWSVSELLRMLES